MLVPGIKLAVVSNFDTRLRPILEELDLVKLFDCVVISAEVGAEKPNPVIFETACSMLGVKAAQSIVLGDDRRQVTAPPTHLCIPVAHALVAPPRWLLKLACVLLNQVAHRGSREVLHHAILCQFHNINNFFQPSHEDWPVM